MRIPLRPATTVLAGALTLSACGGDATAPPSPHALEVVSGRGQTASVTATLPAPVRVRVLDSAGRALEGARVRWRAGDGGRVPVTETLTDSAGMADTPWRLGSRAGEQRLRVVAGPAAAEIIAHATPAAAALVRLAREDVRFQALGDSILLDAVAVVDRFGNRIEGAKLTWRTSDAAVAAVSTTGWVRSTGNGEAEVTGRLEAAVTRVHVAVAQRSEAVRISHDTLRLAPGDTARLDARATDHNGNPIDTALRWASTDTAVILVDPAGRVQARSQGEARVVVRIIEGAVSLLGGGPGSTADTAVVVVAARGQTGIRTSAFEARPE